MSTEKNSAITQWQVLLDDSSALLENSGAHHRKLVAQANILYRSRIISRDELSDMLELADGALAYAIEAQLDAL